MKRLLFITILTFFSIFANAYDFCVNGIYYKIVSIQNRTVEVTDENDRNSYGSHNFLTGEKSSYNITSISIPATVNYKGRDFKVIGIGSEAFRKSNLSKVELPEGLEYIERGAFMQIESLEINLPSTLKIIRANAFKDSFVESLFISKSVEDIEVWALPNASSITIEDSVIPLKLDHMASWGRINVKDIYIGRDILIYEEKYEKENYFKIKAKPLFSYDSPFPDIAFEKSINVTIGKKVKNPTNIFYFNFPDETKIIVQNSIPPQLNFGPLKSNRMFVNWNIEVPQSSLQTYQKAKGWSDFLNLEGR